ncbi:hypothetical protein [Kribbella sp. NPDC000426]|uniref:hypothetical protein n=1 Tax=Kribbella sp. NPDC000426 TaxID=3154255 RepID=UPI00331F2787
MSGWRDGLERFLGTDPHDVGCDGARSVLHLYAELVASGEDAAERFPAVASHLAACESCAEDADGLTALITMDDRPDERTGRDE